MYHTSRSDQSEGEQTRKVRVAGHGNKQKGMQRGSVIHTLERGEEQTGELIIKWDLQTPGRTLLGGRDRVSFSGYCPYVAGVGGEVVTSPGRGAPQSAM